MVKYKLIGVKFPIEDAKLIKKIAVARGEDLSDFVRRSVRKELVNLSFLTDLDKRALGLLNSKTE